MELINQRFFSFLLPPHQFDLSPITKQEKKNYKLLRYYRGLFTKISFPHRKQLFEKVVNKIIVFKREKEKKEEPNHNRANYTTTQKGKEKKNNSVCVYYLPCGALGSRVVNTTIHGEMYAILLCIVRRYV